MIAHGWLIELGLRLQEIDGILRQVVVELRLYSAVESQLIALDLRWTENIVAECWRHCAADEWRQFVVGSSILVS